MANPVVADNKPVPVELEQGKRYYFCACGRSRRQPFCDGSHRDTQISPVEFTAAQSGQAWLCMCKQSKKLPYCDGTHRQFGSERVGTEQPAS